MGLRPLVPRPVRLEPRCCKNIHSSSQLLDEFSTDLSSVLNVMQPRPRDNYGALVQFQTHRVLSGEAAKGWQHHARRVLPETGQCHAFARSLQSHRRMKMACQFIARAGGTLWLVAAGKRSESKWLGNNLQTPGGWRIACVQVMVAANEQHVHAVMAASEVSEISVESGGIAGLRVHQIAKNHQAANFMRVDQGRQAIEITAGMTTGQRHTGGAKTCSLAQMDVGDEKRVLSRPDQRVFGEAEQ